MFHVNPRKPGDPPFDYEQVPWLHIYPQAANHDGVRIIGNPAALLGLAASLQMAVENGKGEADGCVKDGEGYSIEILRTNMTGLRYSSLPYTAEWCRELKRDVEPHPIDFAGAEAALDTVTTGPEAGDLLVREIFSPELWAMIRTRLVRAALTGKQTDD